MSSLKRPNKWVRIRHERYPLTLEYRAYENGGLIENGVIAYSSELPDDLNILSNNPVHNPGQKVIGEYLKRGFEIFIVKTGDRKVPVHVIEAILNLEIKFRE